MSTLNIKEKIKYLSKTLDKHNHLYYVLDRPQITDFEYDNLMSELISLENKYPEFKDPLSPSSRVGGEVLEKFQTVAHRFAMLSLDNTYSEYDLKAFDKRVKKILNKDQIDYSCELKYDGVAISLIYKNGLLQKAITRGDGLFGDDVTENIKTIKSIPLKLSGDFPDILELRGEVFITKLDFEKINNNRISQKEEIRKNYELELNNCSLDLMEKKKLEKKYIAESNKLILYSSPRNLASGTLKLLDSYKVAKRNLSCIVYSVHSKQIFNTHMDSLLECEKWGFITSLEMDLAKNVDDIISFVSDCEVKRNSLPFEIDGVVIKVNNFNQQNILGHTSKSPRWAISYKFKAHQAVTILENVSFQIGRTGVVTPVAHLKPVFIGGSVIKRASLHNKDFIKRLGLKIGDSVIIEKGGDVIPKVVSFLKKKRHLLCTDISFLKECPFCFSLLKKPYNEVNYYCTNSSNCLPQKIGCVEHFISRDAMNINTLGIKTITLLFKQDIISDISSLYDLQINSFTGLKGFGIDETQKNKSEKKARNIINSIQISKKMPFDKVLYGLGIRYVGKTVAKKLVSHFKSIQILRNATRQDLLIIDDVGVKIADSILGYFNNSNNQLLVDKLIQHGLSFQVKNEEKKSNKLQGLSFLISGTFTIPRDEIRLLIDTNSGRNMQSISKKTDYLVVGDNFGVKKREIAISLDVNIITEEDLWKMLE